MATKNNYLSSNDQFNVNDSNAQYNNLNLNLFSNGKKISKFAVIHDSDMNGNERRDKWRDYNNFNNDNGRKEGFWKHGSRRGNMYGQDSSVKGWKKKKDSKTKGATSSTLSIHIAAYENAIQARDSAKTSREKAKHSKKAVKAFSKVLFMNPYEIPRQANDRQLPVPEVVQFKARQKLLPPQTSAGIGAAESFIEQQTQSESDVTQVATSDTISQVDYSSQGSIIFVSTGSDEPGIINAANIPALSNSLTEVTALSTSFPKAASSSEEDGDDMNNILDYFQVGQKFFPQDPETPEEEYKIYDILGVVDQGGCGAILQVKDEKGKEFAIKVEPLKNGTIKREIVIYKNLHFFGAEHIVEIFDHGETKDKKFYYMIMPLMGENLEDFKKSQKNINSYTIARIFQQCLLGIMDIHQSGFLHCDLKPKNIIFAKPGTSERQIVHIIDFGLSFAIENVKQPVESFFGTEEFSSIAAHDKMQQSRGDDLLSLWFSIYTLFKPLPWSTKTGAELIDLKKKFVQDSSGRKTHYTGDLPSQMELMLVYILSIDFDTIPNYGYLHQQLNDMILASYLPGYIQGIHKLIHPVDWDPDTEYVGPNFGGTGEKKRQNLSYIQTENGIKIYVNGFLTNSDGASDENYAKFRVHSDVVKKTGQNYKVYVRNFHLAVAGKYPDVVFFEDIKKRSTKKLKALPPSTPLGEINVELQLVDCDDDYISEIEFHRIFKKAQYGGYIIQDKNHLKDIVYGFIKKDEQKYSMSVDYDTESEE